MRGFQLHARGFHCPILANALSKRTAHGPASAKLHSPGPWHRRRSARDFFALPGGMHSGFQALVASGNEKGRLFKQRLPRSKQVGSTLVETYLRILGTGDASNLQSPGKCSGLNSRGPQPRDIAL